MNTENPEQSEGTTNGSNLRESFERWAVEENYPTRRVDRIGDMYECLDTCIAWDAFQEAHRLTLASLCVGVDSIIAGAYCSLMSKIGDTTTVLAGGFTEAGAGNLFRVSSGDAPSSLPPKVEL